MPSNCRHQHRHSSKTFAVVVVIGGEGGDRDGDASDDWNGCCGGDGSFHSTADSALLKKCLPCYESDGDQCLLLLHSAVVLCC